MGLIRKLGDSMFDSLSKSLEHLQTRISEINLDDVDKLFDDVQDKMNSSFQKLKKQVKNAFDKYVVTVNYDRDAEKLSYNVNGRQLTIIVETLEECQVEETESETSSCSKRNELSVTLPQDVDPTNVSQKYDSENKIMTFTFPKITD